MALLRQEGELAVASVGDSRAVLCREGKAQLLTEDHSARRKDEQQRYSWGIQTFCFLVLGECGHLVPFTFT